MEITLNKAIAPPDFDVEALKRSIGGTSAVISAVAEALAQRGLEVQRIPLTPEKIWLMLRSDPTKRERL